MTPATAYRCLNKLLWRNRLPNAFVNFIDTEAMPSNYGITMWDEDFALPVIFINSETKRWLRVLIHEMIHVAEPSLPHGKTFETLVAFYLREAKNAKKGYRTL